MLRAPQDSSAPPSDTLPTWCWLWGPLALAVVLAIVPHIDREWYRTWVTGEQYGVLEAAQIVLALAGLVIALRILVMPALRAQTWLYLWVGFAAAACFYIAGEEASWGQHYLNWDTPEYWLALNDQGETNLHNTSSWFDQKPRFLMELGVVFGGIVIPLSALYWPALRAQGFGIILPPMLCLPVALLAEFTRMWERIPDHFGGSFHLFGRASEVQEFYFYLFVLLYLLVLRRRLVLDHGDA